MKVITELAEEIKAKIQLILAARWAVSRVSAVSKR